ncbi:Probable polyol transporter 4, partial [Linum grandiflorum]
MYQAIITSIMASVKQIKIRSPTPYMGTVVLAIIVAFPFFLLGYDVAITRASDVIAEDLRLSADQSDHFLMSMSRGPLGVGALAAGVAANFFGRKYTAAFGGGLYTVGILVLACAHSYAVASCGRVLARFGTGMGLLVGPIYIVEISPASVRSFLGHFPQVMMAAGMMTAYTMEAALFRIQPHIGWRLIIGVSALPTLAFTVLACCIPDSPCWLVMLGKVDSARQLLEDCRGPKNDDDDDSDEEEDDEVDARMKQLNRVAGFELYCSGNNVVGAPRRIIGFIEVLQD